ncbi:hypothetical protein NQ315_004510 [Exocentrus adspersus]|uniref:Cation/H+ exchanger transmembrane domain-containing protein n=1 Tax=Exocentrus adspersus TaxID=1586481 RepID=A0AAV8VP81_9CUCU|nr:hypothetical protein NQ315_004510 [Exocentrus adspersus]
MPNSHLKASRKVSINEDVGHDNPSYDHDHRYRKISSNSYTFPGERTRKKSIHELNGSHNAPLKDINENGDSKLSITNSIPSRVTDTIREEDEDDDKGWFYNFCMKCHTKEEGKPSWEPKFWSKLCPHPYFPKYRKFSRIIALFLIGAFAYIILYSIVGEIAAPPEGILYQLILLSICSYFGGWLASLTTFPPLVGMLFTGMLCQNVGVVDIDEDFSEITSEISHLALVIILTRAGLDLDPSALRRLTIPVLKLSLVPWTVEAGAITILSRYFLHISWAYALLLGSIIAAVSPAVVVPCLLRLRAKGYGVAKGIPTLIIAVASIDDAASVAVFGVIKSILFSDASLVNNIIFGTLSIVGATAFEIFWMVIQPILFGVTGARIKFNELDPSVVGASVGILVGAVTIRILSTVLIGFGCQLNLKEKVFVSIAWMCKAIVQAALGPIALDNVEPNTEEYEYAEKILTTCVLSIMVTAPTGALLTTFLGPHLLTKAKMPPLTEVRKRKKSRLSIRDLSLADDDEFINGPNKNDITV